MTLGVARVDGGPLPARARASPARSCATTTQEFYVERPRPLALGQVQALPVPGRLDLGNGPDAIEIELHPAEGHTVDGMALFARPLGLLVVGRLRLVRRDSLDLDGALAGATGPRWRGCGRSWRPPR